MELTKKQRNVLNFIANFIINNSYPPTYSEISSEFGISTTTVQEYIEALIKKGYIEKSGGIARGFVIKDRNFNERIKAKTNTKYVPIIGTVTAGRPILANENIEGYVSFDSNRKSNQNLFALHVSGDSMINAGIFDRDIVIVKPQRSADDGEIVIAISNDEATVKRLKIDEKGYYLKPENPRYNIIRENFNILGKVIGLKRKEMK